MSQIVEPELAQPRLGESRQEVIVSQVIRVKNGAGFRRKNLFIRNVCLPLHKGFDQPGVANFQENSTQLPGHVDAAGFLAFR